MECNIKVKSYFCDVDHKSAVKISVFFLFTLIALLMIYFCCFLIKSASLQNDKWEVAIMAKTHNFIS